MNPTELTDTDAALLQSVQEGVDDALHVLTDPYGVRMNARNGVPGVNIGARTADTEPYPVTVQGFFLEFTCAVPHDDLCTLLQELTIHLTNPPLA